MKLDMQIIKLDGEILSPKAAGELDQNFQRYYPPDNLEKPHFIISSFNGGLYFVRLAGIQDIEAINSYLSIELIKKQYKMEKV